MTELQERFSLAASICPIIAILRGILPNRVEEVADVLVDAGIRVIEIPLNSPDALVSIRRLRSHVSTDIVCGAGTVLTAAQATAVGELNVELCISPNTSISVIKTAIGCGLLPMPGVISATEAFLAVDAGARIIKLFPASQVGPAGIRALLAVMPADVALIAVGGVEVADVASYIRAGCLAVGAGSSLFTPAMDLGTVSARARSLVAAVRPIPLRAGR